MATKKKDTNFDINRFTATKEDTAKGKIKGKKAQAAKRAVMQSLKKK